MHVSNNQTVPQESPIDYSSALHWVDGDRSLLAELAEVFIQDCPQRISELEKAVKEGHADHIKRAAHSLKGMVSGFGAQQAKALAEEMENLGRNERVPEAKVLFGTVRREFLRVIEALRQMHG